MCKEYVSYIFDSQDASKPNRKVNFEARPGVWGAKYELLAGWGKKYTDLLISEYKGLEVLKKREKRGNS